MFEVESQGVLGGAGALEGSLKKKLMLLIYTRMVDVSGFENLLGICDEVGYIYNIDGGNREVVECME